MFCAQKAPELPPLGRASQNSPSPRSRRSWQRCSISRSCAPCKSSGTERTWARSVPLPASRTSPRILRAGPLRLTEHHLKSTQMPAAQAYVTWSEQTCQQQTPTSWGNFHQTNSVNVALSPQLSSALLNTPPPPACAPRPAFSAAHLPFAVVPEFQGAGRREGVTHAPRLLSLRPLLAGSPRCRCQCQRQQWDLRTPQSTAREPQIFSSKTF